MLLWILSDLHVELTRNWDLPFGNARPRFDVLVIAGDLIPRAERGVRWLRERVPDNPVIYVPGNHEAYGTDIDRTVEKAQVAAQGSEVVVLQNREVKIGEVTFAGGTLWTDFNLFGDPQRAMSVAGERMNDFRKIRMARYVKRFLPHHALSRHWQTRSFLEAAMRTPRSGPLVVVTHHAPMPDRAFRSGSPSPAMTMSDDDILNAAFRSDLTPLMWSAPVNKGIAALRPPDLWIYGHTHETENTMIGNTRVVSNAKGYGPWPPRQKTWENPRFDPSFVIEI